MQISDILAQMGGMQSMAKSLGVSEQDAMQGAAALLPAILGGMKKQAQNAGGADLGGLLSMLDANGDGNVLDDILRAAGKLGR